jgi:hypothetical protein
VQVGEGRAVGGEDCVVEFDVYDLADERAVVSFEVGAHGDAA